MKPIGGSATGRLLAAVLPWSIAVVAGAAAFWGAATYLAQRVAESEARVAAEFALAPVIVAAEDLPAGTMLSADNLAVRRVPERFAPSSARPPEGADGFYGRLLAWPLRAGDPVGEAALRPAGAGTLSSRLGPGRRAITIPVDTVNGFAGLLSPGDRIDLVYVSSLQADPVRTAARPLLESVLVLATGRRMAHAAGGSFAGDSGAGGVDDRYTSVTLDVTPAAAQRLILAQRLGELTALLRHPADDATGVIDALDASVLEPSRASGGARRRVPIITGGGRASEARRGRLPGS